MTRVLVIGDFFTDRTIFYETQRESPEGGHPVVRMVGTLEGPGGAGAVAASFVTFSCTRLGRAFAETVGSGRPRQLKCRHVVDGKVAFRVDDELTPATTGANEREIRGVNCAMSDTRAIIVADHGKGVVTEELFAAAVALRKRLGIPLYVDPAMGRPLDFYDGATSILLNHREAMAASGINPHDQRQKRIDGLLNVWAFAIAKKMELDALVIKKGPMGFTAYTRSGKNLTSGGSECSAYDLVDPSGAGDVFIAVMASQRIRGSGLRDAIASGNQSAGEKCRYWGAVHFHFSQIGTNRIPVVGSGPQWPDSLRHEVSA